MEGLRSLQPGATLRPAVFLDRDGTINVEVSYLGDPERLELLPGVAQAIALLNQAGYVVVVVSNQAGIARGYYDVAGAEAVHHRLAEVLAASGAHIDAFYICPHHPGFTGECPCRKPRPGMLRQAAAELRLDLSRSWCVGDKASDVEAGLAAGCRTILVRTGYGAEHECDPRAWTGARRADMVLPDLPAAVAAILESHAKTLAPGPLADIGG